MKLSLQLRHRQVEELEHLLETCRSEADELHANIASSEHLLAETTAADERTRAELAAANTSLEAQRHAIAELRRRVEIQTREAESLSLAVESQRAECLAQRVERVALQDELANANRRIEDVYKSWSWRATAWGRAAYRALTGR